MNPGIYDLGDSAIGAAVSGIVITRGVSSGGVQEEFIDNLDGMLGVALQCNFTYGGGGATVKIDIETSLDQGFSWVPIARFAFAVSSAQRIMNLSANTSKLTPHVPAPLSDDIAVDGVLGDRLRAKLTNTGTYTGNSSISVRAVVR